MLPSCEKKSIVTSCDGIDFEGTRFFDIKGVDAFWYKTDTLHNFEGIHPTDSITLSELGGLFVEYEAEYHASKPLLNKAFSLISKEIFFT